MYEGIMQEAGKRVSDEDAFSYACERTEHGSDEEKKAFMDIVKTSDTFDEIADRTVEWYFSGCWVRRF